MDATTPLPHGPPTVREEPSDGPLPFWVHGDWSRDFPWLVQGVTARGVSDTPADFALFGGSPAGRVQERWASLGRATGADRVVHGRQVHGAAVRLHGAGPPGLHVVPDTDGHVTRDAGVLLTVATADCVPMLLVDPRRRVVCALHGGWRGVAAGILERGLDVLAGRLACRPGDLHLHLGPAICGSCYEVGPEVHRALGLPDPGGPRPVDLRAVLARRAVALGLGDGAVSVSAFCTRCGDGRETPFFSHRGGDPERQIAFVGIRD